jgi:vancomycin permeability regulator SanA
VNSRLYLISVIVVLLVDNCISFITRYTINNLHVTAFDLSFIGNIIGIAFLLAALTGVVVKTFLNTYGKSIKIFCLILAILALASNITAWFVIKWEVFGMGNYLLGFPANKFFASLLIIARTFIQIYFIAFVWMSIFRKDNWNILRAVIVSVIVLFLLSLFSFFYIQKDIEDLMFAGGDNKTAVVLGAAVYKNNLPSPLFEARIRKAYDLYKDSIVSKILVTGSNAPGEITEAESARKFLRRLGVDRKYIEVEDQSRATIDQMRYIKETYLKKHLNTEIIIISDKFHLTRTSEICRFLGIRFAGVASDYDVSDNKLLFYKTRESISLLVFWLFGI